MRESVGRGLLFALVLIVLLVPVFSNAATSYATITLHSTGETGSNVAINTGRAKTAGRNDGEGAWNILFVAVQLAGSNSITAHYSINPGCTLSEKICDAPVGNYHVLLDPAGPNFSGCVGAGGVAPKATN